MDPRSLLGAQRTLAVHTVDELERELGDAPDGGSRMLLRYRVETARGVLRFVEAVLADGPA